MNHSKELFSREVLPGKRKERTMKTESSQIMEGWLVGGKERKKQNIWREYGTFKKSKEDRMGEEDMSCSL